MRWCFLVVFAFGCGGTATLTSPRSHIALETRAPIPDGAQVPAPSAGGSGTVPVRGIRHGDYLLGLFRVGSSPYEIDVRAWSEFFERSLIDELRRTEVTIAPDARLHVEVRRLDVDIPEISGGVTCTLAVDAIRQTDSGGRLVFPIEAGAKANSGRACIARASAGVIRHILLALWFSGTPKTPKPATAVVERGPVERAELLPGTEGRYGFLWSFHFGGGRMRLSGADDFADESRTAVSFGLTFGISMTRNLFLTANAYADSATAIADTQTTIGHGGAGFGVAYYLKSSILLSSAFMLDLPLADESAFEAPGMGFHAMVGKEWKLTDSLWFGGAARGFASWSFENDSRLVGVVLMTTIASN